MSRRPALSFALLLALFAVAAAEAQIPTLACNESIALTGFLNSDSPTYNRVESGSTAQDCEISTYGTSVYYSALAVDAQTAGFLVASFCDDVYNFDTFLSVYQEAAGGAGAFDPLDPCTNLLAANDDTCGLLSRVATDLPSTGEVTVVVSSYSNGTTGNFTLDLSMACPVQTIPTLGATGFAVLGVLLLAAGFVMLRRRGTV